MIRSESETRRTHKLCLRSHCKKRQKAQCLQFGGFGWLVFSTAVGMWVDRSSY